MSGMITRWDIKAASRLCFATLGVALYAAVFLSCSTSTTQAAIVWSGNVSPTNPATWTSSTTGYIGQSSIGTVNCDTGSKLLSKYGYVGYSSSSTGTASISGSGSKWANTNDLYVGYGGSGTLNIESGGQLACANGYLGYYSGSVGTVTVTGTDSTWINSSNLYVGSYGSGTLTVTAGGTVSAVTIFAPLSSLQGDGTITTNGAVLDGDLVLNASSGSLQTVNFGSGGILNLNLNGKGYLGAGYKATGTLTISNGLAVTSSWSRLGYYPGSNGTVTISGAGSQWINNGSIDIGFWGTGTLKIEAGGQVTNVNGSSVSCLGVSSGSTGTATISGIGSKWTTEALLVGGVGFGTLNIGSVSESGGMVIANYLSMGNSSFAHAVCNLTNGGMLKARSIVRSAGIAEFNWNDGIIQNYNAINDLSVGSSMVLKLASTGTHFFSIDLNRIGTVDAVLADATSGGTLNKNGPGTLILTAANTYTGKTTVEAGRFKVTGSILNTSEIDVSTGATLELAKTSSSATASTLAISNAGTILISAGSQTVGTISGTGVTQVNAGTLTTKSIVQNSLFIGTTGAASLGGKTMNQVPEPSMWALLLLVAIGGGIHRKFSKAHQGK